MDLVIDVVLVVVGCTVAAAVLALWGGSRRCDVAAGGRGVLFGGLLLGAGVLVASVGGALEADAWALALAVAAPIGSLVVRFIVDFELANAARRREQERR